MAGSCHFHAGQAHHAVMTTAAGLKFARPGRHTAGKRLYFVQHSTHALQVYNTASLCLQACVCVLEQCGLCTCGTRCMVADSCKACLCCQWLLAAYAPGARIFRPLILCGEKYLPSPSHTSSAAAPVRQLPARGQGSPGA